MYKVTIDGRSLNVKEGTTILAACEQLGIKIPTLCHLNHLDPAGSCRICVVEVKGVQALQISCATPCRDGMEVTTMNERIYKFRRMIVELMLANHDIDCFTCSANGRCELYQLALDYGVEQTRFAKVKNVGAKDETNEFLNYDPTKCILCRRCVRVCHELQSSKVLSLKNRGIDTAVAVPYNQLFRDYDCVSCGNCASVCPTGALTTKESKTYREWEITRTRTTCPYCGVGCQMDLLVKNGKVVGVEPAEGHTNPSLLCVKGKFAYHFIDHPERLTTPLIRKNGALTPASWDEALDYVADGIKRIRKESGPEAIAGFASGRASNEDTYVFQKMMRAAIGSNSVDNCARV